MIFDYFKVFLILMLLLMARVNCRAIANSPPHIVFIIADDMGWNDVGFHGSDQIPTPNIDALAYNGLILNQHYTQAICTPSRAALLTGKYPIHTGMQHSVIIQAEPWGLGLEEILLPQRLSKAGYKTHAVGKWHLGFFEKAYTPTFRGFESHYGYYQGLHDYYSHCVTLFNGTFKGYDMRRNLDVDWSAKGKYSTDLFTQEALNIIDNHDTANPLFLYLAHLAPHAGNTEFTCEAPDDLVARFSHIEDPQRRTYAAMVSKLDESVGEVVAALRSKNMLDNSVIVFLSDNGAPTHGIYSNGGSNYPFRGIKNSAWEGGVRGVAAVWSPLIKKPQRVANQLMYITDWMPTLYSLAGLDSNDLGDIDGVDMWQALSEDLPSPRREILYNIDDEENPYAALRIDDWKYVTGSATGERNGGWYGESGQSSGVEFNPQSVLLSKAGIAISAFIIKEQIQEKIKKSNGIVDDVRHFELLQIPTMLDLRAEAEIECQPNNMTDVSIECRPMESPCLFNLKDDPCETVNLAHTNPRLVQNLEESIEKFRKTMIKARNLPSDSSANPIFWNSTWTYWQDEIENELFDFTLFKWLSTVLYMIAFLICVSVLIFVYPKFVFLTKSGPESGKTMSVFTLNPPAKTEKK